MLSLGLEIKLILLTGLTQLIPDLLQKFRHSLLSPKTGVHHLRCNGYG